MANEKFTQLPTVVSSTMGDIIAAVQAGTSVQQTLQQVFDLFSGNVILHFAGNPNGNVAGDVYQLCWDTTHNLLFVCTTSGNAATAVWKPSIGQLTNGQLLIGSTGLTPVAATLTAGAGISIANGAGTITISGTGSGIGWTEVTGTTQAMVADSAYVANNAGTVTLTLPATASFGTAIVVLGKGAGGWSIAQNAGQNIQIGSSSSTVGVGGSVSSTNRWDSITMICVTADTTWSQYGAPQGNLTVV